MRMGAIVKAIAYQVLVQILTGLGLAAMALGLKGVFG